MKNALKNFTVMIILMGALWGTPLSFVLQKNVGVETRVASAQFPPPPTTSVRATVAPTGTVSNSAAAFKLKCFERWTINFGDCGAIIGYGLFYVPTSLVLIAGGTIFDVFMALSLDRYLLNQPFVRTTWGVVRDLANLVFILILLWIAIATILRIGGVQLKQAVVNVIIIALLINFSFFFTRVVIDASNVVAFSFYSAIGGGGRVTQGNHIPGVTEYRISEKIMGAVNPQTLLSPETFQKWAETNDASKGWLFFLFLVGGVINLILAYVLFYAGFLLLGRVIAFVFLVIAAPLAFISYALPKGGSFTGSWWNQLLNQALVAPVFLFFLYVIVQLAGSTATMFSVSGTTAVGNFTEILTTVLLKASIIVVALMIALNKTKSLSGSAGQWATKAGTVAFGAALGGTALAARHTVGRGARALADSDAVKRFNARTGVLGEATDRALRATSSSSLDFRALPGAGAAGLGKPTNKGGFDKHLKDQMKRKVDFGKSLEKDKRGEPLLATNWMGKPVKEKVWEEREVLRASSSGATDAFGNPIMEKVKEKYQVDKDVTAKDAYINKLADKKKLYFFKKEGYKQSRSDRDAAIELKKKDTKADKIQKMIDESGKEQAEQGASEKVAEAPKEPEAPKAV